MAIPQTPSPLTQIVLSSTYNAAWYSSTSKEASIQAAINAAAADGAKYVFVPAAMLGYDASQVTFNTSIRMIAEGGSSEHYDAIAYGALGDGVSDNTAEFAAWLNAGTANQGKLVVSKPGKYLSGQITDTTGTRLKMELIPGVIIAPTSGTWLKVVPGNKAKFGVNIRGIQFDINHGVAQTPVIWLEGSSSGGIVDVNIDDIDFGDLTGQTCDLLWARACFNGSIGNLWANNAYLCRGVLYSAAGFNSGNMDFGQMTFGGIGVGLQLGQAFNNANMQLLNTINVRVLKSANNAPTTGCFQEVTLTAQANIGDTTLTVSGGDATKVANALTAGTPQFVGVMGNSVSGDMIRALSASGTTIVLAAPVPQVVSNGTLLPVGSFGVVIGTNVRGVTFHQLHTESVGFGMLLATAQQVTVIGWRTNADAGGIAQVGAYCSFGTQDTLILQPIISNGGTQFTGLLCTNQGTNQRNQIVEPAFYGGGGGILAVFTDNAASITGKQNRFIRMASGEQKGSITYSASVTPDESFDTNLLTVTDGNAFTVNLPTNRCDGRRFAIVFNNQSGGAMGAVTFAGGYQLAGAFTAPATGKQRTYVFNDDAGANVHEVSRTAADVTT